ncbi:hypothetical protein NEOLEDRAFT_1162439 [Neolentinus lepideus HHB14362 ss-1]|uniref:Uncharacterized protein n=1 Tax=Neolentinus lepideus HHB14362 ss-1 TaxID=1314782 RepID=A0A165T2P3_9AGAM|nr:hypothetical protein NEOLEDRAFT_1162439 [Neolentinus lepideus HHB14362 ss-1]
MSLSLVTVQRRALLSSAFSELKRVRPRVPFWELGAHRIPTLWTLYRGLLKQAPNEHIRFRIKCLFRNNQSLTSPKAAKEQLVKGHRWLDIFCRANEGDERLQLVLDRYTRLVAIRREKQRWRKLITDAMKYQEQLRNRPIMTGSFIRPSHYNKPLPRLKPQPIHITGMIVRRKHARFMRTEKVAVYSDYRRLLKEEEMFEKILEKEVQRYGEHFEPIFKHHMNEWRQPIVDALASLSQSFQLDTKRETAPYPPELVEMVRDARREKIANKTKERERERRGEVLACTLRRMNKGPPAHVAYKMTDEEKRMDRISRSPSEVGYVAVVKKKLGFKLRKPDAWKVEIGKDEDQEKLHKVALEIEEENRRRRSLRLRDCVLTLRFEQVGTRRRGDQFLAARFVRCTLGFGTPMDPIEQCLQQPKLRDDTPGAA